MKNKQKQEIAIYQGANGKIEFRGDFDNENIWASKKQISELFGVERSVISRHIKNILQDQELDKKKVCAKFAHTTKHGAIKGKIQTRELEYYNLDIILAVGYRTKSSVAILFRKWATKTLKQHLTKGYTLNKKLLKKNHQEFLKTIDDMKLLAQNNNKVSKSDILELIKAFSSTWFNLESYDKQKFPTKGKVNKKVDFEKISEKLYKEIEVFKKELISKKEATELFAQEKEKESLKAILGNIFQSVFGQDVYQAIEEKAAHLLYFIIKNHPFNDGNKRTGAFSFIWFLREMNFSFLDIISPETLTTLALLIAESNPKEKEKMVGLILLLLKK